MLYTNAYVYKRCNSKGGAGADRGQQRPSHGMCKVHNSSSLERMKQQAIFPRDWDGGGGGPKGLGEGWRPGGREDFKVLGDLQEM